MDSGLLFLNEAEPKDKQLEVYKIDLWHFKWQDTFKSCFIHVYDLCVWSSAFISDKPTNLNWQRQTNYII